MKQITPNLWFDDQAEEAASFYVSLFPDSEILRTTRYDEESAKASGKPVGSILTVEFRLNGQDFIALNGGPEFKFTEAISFMVDCDTQEEVDNYWEELTAGGGEEGQCGWLKDKFGLSWQVVPVELNKLLSDPDPEKAQKAMRAMLQMKKLDINTLKQAAEA